MSSASSITSRFNREIPRECKCHLPLKMRTSWTLSNPARRFLVCPNSLKRGEKCDAFFWYDPELHNRRYREIMYEIYNVTNPNNRQEITRNDETEELLRTMGAEFDLYKSKTCNDIMFLQQQLKKSEAVGRFYKKLIVVMVLLASLFFIVF